MSEPLLTRIEELIDEVIIEPGAATVLLVDGVLQHQDGVLSIRAEHVQGIEGSASVNAHDFYEAR